MRVFALSGCSAAFALLCVLALGACEGEVSQGPVPSCDHVIWEMTPTTGPTSGGTEVVVDGYFIAGDSERDVVVRVGSTDADVTSMSRVGCDPCDACTTENLLCASCDRECRGLTDYTDGAGTVYEPSACVETLGFTTPPGESGPATVTIMNSRGSSDDLTFVYEGAGDDDDSAGDDDDSAGDDDDSAGDDDDSAGDDDDSAGDDDDSAGDDDDSAGDDDDSAGDDDDSAGDDD
ncbi:MAG: IPT/TIG domain-containing protein, partial [Deltaproteobacteria bacterium]|nr:IPT/TIG domain-containing protein [Deltaproteobacteria bacterium]